MSSFFNTPEGLRRYFLVEITTLKLLFEVINETIIDNVTNSLDGL